PTDMTEDRADPGTGPGATASRGEAPPVEPRMRAQPMSPDARRAMIAEQAVPLFLEHGAGLTTRQLAEHLGIAEGTIFRAFGDKESLVRAAVQTFFEQGRQRMAGGIVDPSLPLEEKVAAVVSGARTWMRSMFRMLSLVDRSEVPELMSNRSDDAYRAAIAAAFAPDAEALRIPAERLGSVMRIANIAATAARFDEHAALSDDELVDFILYGIAGAPRGKD
ncbi:MAG: TetR/AcrR family transcriptional regulator, partial [Microbacterium sp.]|nr:TetR/AcrR family transcriptional regulator [Microbacterium sp.]